MYLVSKTHQLAEPQAKKFQGILPQGLFHGYDENVGILSKDPNGLFEAKFSETLPRCYIKCF